MLVAALVAAGCGARSADAPRTTPAIRTPTVQSLLRCLRAVGADGENLSSRRDLRVSIGEVGVTFSTFEIYIGVAVRRAEAIAAAGALDDQLAVLQQAGAARVSGRTVFYTDGVAVPEAVDRLVVACIHGDVRRAARALVAVARELPIVELPQPIETSLLTRCRVLGSASACACVYERAQRLFRFSQMTGLASKWRKRRALPVLAGLLRTCAV